MIDLYLPSLLLLFSATYFALPFLAVKNYKYLGIIVFYIFLFSVSLARPYQAGIDNSNFISVLTNDSFLTSDLYTDDFYKYSVLYFLAYFIPGTWQKLFFLNSLFSLVLVVIQFKFFARVFTSLSFINGSYTFLLLSYNALIIPPLVLVHFKQFVAFVLVSILCFRYPNPRLFAIKSPFKSLLLSLFILVIHPAYIGFIIFYYIYCYFDYPLSFFFKLSSQSKTFFLLLLSVLSLILIYSAPYIFSFLINLLPGFSQYGLESELIDPDLSYFGLIYPLILPLPILFFILNSSPLNRFPSLPHNHLIPSLLVLYVLLFSVSFTEYTFSSFYSIGRVKSSLYPALLLYAVPLYTRTINSKFAFYTLWLFMFILTVASFSRFVNNF